MAVDTPATIAIIGGGPIGLEAGLYARFLGYDVLLFERGEIASHIEAWGHVEMFTPFSMNRSSLALAALDAQGLRELPAGGDYLTGKEWRKRYLLPLSQTDLLADSIHTKTSVIDVSRQEILKHEMPGSEDRATSQFRVVVVGPSGEASYLADVVIDCSGVVGRPNRIGAGGALAVGEREICESFHHLPPDLSGRDRQEFAGKTTLLVGAGYSAATTAVALATVAETDPETRFVWAIRDDREAPIRRIVNDRLPTRDALAKAANDLAASDLAASDLAGANRCCTIRRSSGIESVRRDDVGRYSVRFTGEEKDQLFDNIVANVGFRGDTSITEQLQVHRCYASDGPMKLAAALMQSDSVDCLDQTSSGAASLQNPEPDFYMLGSKSYGRNPNFLYSLGLEQIRDVFTDIGDRESLDLYATMEASS
jgi:hypothetical protein